MIDSVVEAFKAFLLPGSLSFLLLLGTLATILIFTGGRWGRIGRRAMAALFALYWFLALPFVSSALVWALDHGYQPIQTGAEAEGSQAIVVLGGGAATYAASGARLSQLSDASSLRTLEGARLYHLLGPQSVIVSGGPSGPTSEPESDVLRRAMLQLGIPADRIVEERTSGNTYEQAINLSGVLSGLGVTRFVLVTSGVHMPRAMSVFRHAGLDPIPSPAPEQSEADRGSGQSLLPSLEALRTSQAAIREDLGLLYYGLRGWLSPPAEVNTP